MAVPPKTDEAFLREVDEELRRDQLTAVWTRYGRWMIGALVLGLAIFAGVLFWQQRSVQAAGVQGERLQAAYDDLAEGKAAAAATPLQEIASSGAPAYRANAKLTQADILMRANDMKGAAAKFAEIAADTSLAQPYRDLALIRQTTAEYDVVKPDVVINRLRALAVKGNPWFGTAGEMVAIAYVRQGRSDLAGPLFAAISREKTVPETIRQRAVQMAGLLGIDAVDQPEEKKAK